MISNKESVAIHLDDTPSIDDGVGTSDVNLSLVDAGEGTCVNALMQTSNNTGTK